MNSVHSWIRFRDLLFGIRQQSSIEADSGRLDWSSGDDGQRTVTVRILDDSVDEIREWFGVSFSGPGGGAQLIAGVTSVVIDDDDEASSTPPPPPLGGGGSVSWATQLALLTLLVIRGRQNRRAAAG
jgi:hypothetical protein